MALRFNFSSGQELQGTLSKERYPWQWKDKMTFTRLR